MQPKAHSGFWRGLKGPELASHTVLLFSQTDDGLQEFHNSLPTSDDAWSRPLCILAMRPTACTWRPAAQSWFEGSRCACGRPLLWCEVKSQPADFWGQCARLTDDRPLNQKEQVREIPTPQESQASFHQLRTLWSSSFPSVCCPVFHPRVNSYMFKCLISDVTSK